MPTKVHITPSVLKWARKTAKISLKDAARKVGHATPEKLIEWEKGTDNPTLDEVEQLCNAYRRPLAVLYLPEPPKGFRTLRDIEPKARRTSQQCGRSYAGISDSVIL